MSIVRNTLIALVLPMVLGFSGNSSATEADLKVSSFDSSSVVMNVLNPSGNESYFKAKVLSSAILGLVLSTFLGLFVKEETPIKGALILCLPGLILGLAYGALVSSIFGALSYTFAGSVVLFVLSKMIVKSE